MKASKYIEELRRMIVEYGDLDCEDTFGNQVGQTEFNDDEEPIFVLADKA